MNFYKVGLGCLLGFGVWGVGAAKAAVVTATVTGTIASGTDGTGVFVGKNAALAGLPFKVTYTFDTTKGVQGSNGVSSYIKQTRTSNPGTAVLEINGRTWTFGVYLTAYNYPTSEMYRSVGCADLYFEAGDGALGDGSSIQIPFYPSCSAVTDPNWDDALSLSNLNAETGQFQLSEGANRASGSFLLSTITISGLILNPAAISFAPLASIPSGASAAGISPMMAAADFNGDGVMDLVTANVVDNTVSVLLGKGNGSFQAPVSYKVGRSPYGVVAGDFNADGFPDIAVVNGLDNTVSVLLNNKSGGFPATPSYTYAVGSEPLGLSMADLNKDGFLDLVVANTAAGSFSVLLGKGDGTFQAQMTYATGSYPFGTALADVNGDAYPDIVAWNENSNTVGVYLNDTTGKFAAPVTYATGTAPYGVAAADFNGDGYTDLAIANLGDNTVSVLLNDTTGSFVHGPVLAAGVLPASVVAADMNGDGVADLSVASLGNGTVSVLLGKGDGTFLSQSTYLAGDQPYALLAADFNGDGLPDLAVTSFYDSTLGVLLQTASTGSSGKVKGVPKVVQRPVKIP